MKARRVLHDAEAARLAAQRANGRAHGEARCRPRCHPRRSPACSGVGRYAAGVGELGQADATSPAPLRLASDWPGGLRDRNQLRAPRTVARLPPTGADLGPDSIRASWSPAPRARSRRLASPTTSSAPGKVTARSGSRGGAGSAGWRESPRQEREDWVTTVRAALSAGSDNDRDVVQSAGSPIVSEVQPDHPTGR